jgi:hypothetical protein
VVRLVFAGGIAALVALVLRDYGASPDEIAIVVDPGPVADSVRALRIEVAEGERSLGGVERVFVGGERGRPIHLTTPAPAQQAEITIELETIAGARRVRRVVDAPAGSIVTIVIDGIDPVSTAPSE